LLSNAARSLSNLGDTADLLVDAANDLSGLPDATAALQRAIDDWKRNRPEY
jgi:hypothetical protein